ncbi:MAG TPA: helix-turn-helix domain-containing protein [Gammaproteobacteria bacterium]|nr:helix-turn-helix domain-containing protein [Gammaproteobacteria bacterium]
MLEFYRKAIAVFLGLVVLTALLGYACFDLVFFSNALLPAHESSIPWKSRIITDQRMGGSSSVSVIDDIYSLDFEYRLSNAIKYPHVYTMLAFAEPGSTENLADLSRFTTTTFKVKCSARNVLGFYVHTFDKNVTNPADFPSYRIASALFSCHEQWSDVEIDLRYLKVPRWWQDMAHVDISNQDYWLNQVLAISFVASWQGAADTPARVKIGELTLHGRNWRYVWFFGGLLALIWIGFAGWLFRRYTRSLIVEVENKLKKDRPLIAYKKLTIEPHRNKEKSQVLHFMATQYRNPDMSLEFAVESLGINRTKINELLKDELGMTFGTYLNKLRLAEAARLLSQQDSPNVAEVARQVGYINASYFNKLFKSEYGCTPGTFIGVQKSE